MLKKLFSFFDSPASRPQGRVIAEKEHQIPLDKISKNALKVIDNLQNNGYQAFLVGGGVRDLLLSGRPKDFDVATSATPEEVRGVFKNSRIIGRRFRIVHVVFGRDIIEVTTFRAGHESANGQGDAVQSESGVLLRDNVYGDIESDALRRDFTINALYYDPRERTLYDYTQGLEDLRNRVIKVIGDPDSRYREDPVRMLRALRFSAKLGFALSPEAESPIHEHGNYLRQVPPARLFEEVLKLFMSGYATATLALLEQYQLLGYLFPEQEHVATRAKDYELELVHQAAHNTDKRIRQNKRVTPAFIYAAFLWPALRSTIRFLMEEESLTTNDALQSAAQQVISRQLQHTAIPKRFLIPMREIWTLQLRLGRREGKRAYALVTHPRFRAAYDFLLLREQAGENLDGLGMWWTRFQDTGEHDQAEMLKELNGAQKPRKRRRSRRRTSSSDMSGNQNRQSSEPASEQ